MPECRGTALRNASQVDLGGRRLVADWAHAGTAIVRGSETATRIQMVALPKKTDARPKLGFFTPHAVV